MPGREWGGGPSIRRSAAGAAWWASSTEPVTTAPRPFVQFRLTMSNLLLTVLRDLAASRGDTAGVAWAEEQEHQAEREALEFARSMQLPGVPQLDDDVLVLDGCAPCQVQRVLWVLDPIDDEEVALVYLSDLDPDQYGTTSDAAATLLDRGWVPLFDVWAGAGRALRRAQATALLASPGSAFGRRTAPPPEGGDGAAELPPGGVRRRRCRRACRSRDPRWRPRLR